MSLNGLRFGGSYKLPPDPNDKYVVYGILAVVAVVGVIIWAVVF